MRWLIILPLFILSLSAWSQELSLEDFVVELSTRQSQVEEFVQIKKIASELGIKHVYMFGGTAAAWGHYVRWDMIRELGIEKLQKGRFDYDYTSIFRANQDFDVVIEGTVEQAQALEKAVQSEFNYFSGSRPTWEVRLLNEKRLDKDAIMGDDFQNQHTDSHSTGLIEMMDCEGFDCVKDVRDIKNSRSAFLMDMYEARLTYYFSKLHKNTSRYQNKMNPEILSVIRYFTKAVQYELAMREDDVETLEKMIRDFNPSEASTWDSYVTRWLEKNAKKLIVNAVDMEYAQQLLEKVGLKSKLLQLGDPQLEDTMSWWLNKEALKSFEVGRGNGETAAEIFEVNENGDIIVAHETNSFPAYESITKAHDGSANVLISRQGVIGEAAVYGDGHYTRLGRIGARSTGLTIRYKLNPKARLGSDFHQSDDFIIVQNRNALTVIYELIEFQPIEYFEKIAAGLKFDVNDKGVEEKLKRRINRKLSRMSDDEKLHILQILQDGVESGKVDNKVLLHELSKPWAIELGDKWSDLIEVFINQNTEIEIVASQILSNPEVIKTGSRWEELVSKYILRCQDISSISTNFSNMATLVHKVLSNPLVIEKKEKWIKWANQYLEVGHALDKFAMYVLAEKEVIRMGKTWENLVHKFLSVDKGYSSTLIMTALSEPEAIRYGRIWEELIEKTLKNISKIDVVVESLLSRVDVIESTEKWLEWAELYLNNRKKLNKEDLKVFIKNVLGNPKAAEIYPEKYVEWVDKYLFKTKDSSGIAEHVLGNPSVFKMRDHWDRWYEQYLLIENRKSDLPRYVLSQDFIIDNYEGWLELVEKYINSGIGNSEIVYNVISSEKVYQQKELWLRLIKLYIDKGHGLDGLLMQVLMRPQIINERPKLWKEIVFYYIEKGKKLDKFSERIFNDHQSRIPSELYKEVINKYLERGLEIESLTTYALSKSYILKSESIIDYVKQIFDRGLRVDGLEVSVLTSENVMKDRSQWYDWCKRFLQKTIFSNRESANGSLFMNYVMPKILEDNPSKYVEFSKYLLDHLKEVAWFTTKILSNENLFKSHKSEWLEIYNYYVEKNHRDDYLAKTVLSEEYIIYDIQTWFELSKNYIERADDLLDLAEKVLSKPELMTYKDKWLELINLYINKAEDRDMWPLAQHVLNKKHAIDMGKTWEGLVERYFAKSLDMGGLASHFLNKVWVIEHEDLWHKWLVQYMEVGEDMDFFAQHILKYRNNFKDSETWMNYVKAYIDKGKRLGSLAKYVLSDTEKLSQEEIYQVMNYYINNGKELGAIANYALTYEAYAQNIDQWLEWAMFFLENHPDILKQSEFLNTKMVSQIVSNSKGKQFDKLKQFIEGSCDRYYY